MSTSSAAAKAAKSLGGSSRNRPSHSMSQASGDSTPGAGGAPPSGGGSTPLFMDDVQSQYESLSERLLKENAPSSNPDAPKKGVRFKDTAALASTMDGGSPDGGDESPPRSPMDVVSDLFQKKYTIPTFLAAAAGIFLLVHLTGGPQDERNRLYGAPPSTTTGASPGRDFNVGGGDGFGDIIFSLSPSLPPGASHPPTMEAMSHITPKIPGRQPSTGTLDGNDPDWILVPTSSAVYGPDKGSPTTLKWNYPPGAPTPNPALLLDKGSPTTLKWNYPPGAPTPNPALLVDGGSPTTLKWNYPPGFPTPNPALLKSQAGQAGGGPDDGSPTTLQWGIGGRPEELGSPTTLKWGYPPGVPTPNPALLVEVASPYSPLGGPDATSPTTLKWNIPYGQPTPDPANLDAGSPTTLAWGLGGGGPDDGSPTTLKWGYPPGVPTPNPALLDKGGPTTMKWGYPPGVPTPDPALLVDVGGPTTMKWGYPPGVPTPNPALLDAGGPTTMGWGYPPGEPTPNPALLKAPGAPKGPTPPPTIRKVEVGVLLTAQPTERPTKLTEEGVSLKEPEQPKVPPVDTKVVDDPALAPPPPGMQPTDTEVFDDPALAPPPPGQQPTDTEVFDEPALAPPPPDDPALAPPPPGMQPTGTEVFDEPALAPPPPGQQPTDPVIDTKVIQDPNLAPPGMAPAGMAPPPDVPSGFDYNGNPVEIAPPTALPPAPPPPRPARPQRPPAVAYPQVPPSPQVNTQPYSGASGFTGYPDGPNGYNIPGGGVQQTQGFFGGGWNTGNVVGGGTGGYMLPMSVQYVPMYMPMNMGGFMTEKISISLSPTPVPGCPGVEECIVDETVPTMGRSNEDDAIYEIFYTNPLRCCGTIVEIGAGNGKQFSSSYFFQYGMNWTSILTEADPLEFGQIANNRPGEKVQLTNGAFCLESPHLFFDAQSRNFQSVSNGEYTSEITNQKFNVTDATQKVNCIRLDNDVLAGLDHIDVMVIRVKGDPWAVLRTMDWEIKVDIWVILMEQKEGMNHDTLRASLKLHDYVPAAWEIKLWCDTPANCMDNEVWLRKSFNPLPKPLLGSNLMLHGQGGSLDSQRNLRGSHARMLPFARN